MTAPLIPENDDEPSPDDYEETDVAEDTAATKDLLLWMRKHGFGAQVVTVGSVQVTNLTDMYPRKQMHEGRARRPAHVNDMSDFATDEERDVLYGSPSDDGG